MPISQELIFLIYFLYLINCVRIIDKDAVLLIYNYKKVIIDFPNKYLQIDKQQIAYLNPLKFYMPTFTVNKKDNKILKEIKFYSVKLRKLLPIVTLIWIDILALLPLSLYLGQELFTVISSAALYLFILLLSIIVWTNRGEYQISKKEASILILDYFLAPPFAINALRDLSLKKKYG